MLLIASALQEELDVALELCTKRSRIVCGRCRLYRASRLGQEIHLLKTGVGPERSGARLKQLLDELRPSHILVAGYVGALTPSLRIGDLIIGRSASILGQNPAMEPSIESLELAGSWKLAQVPLLSALAQSRNVAVAVGDLLTSPHLIGGPGQKALLYAKYHSAGIDMETASLARVAASSGITLSCVRSVTDEAEDDFLAPFSYDPKSGFKSRAGRVIGAGRWIGRFRDWRQRAEKARSSLRVILDAYLQDLPQRGG